MKKKLYLIINILIVILELISFITIYKNNNHISIEYYTEESNILAFITCTIFTIYLIFNKKIPKWLVLLKYTSTICLTLTFLVVLLILAPMFDFDYIGMFFKGIMLYHHFLCPVLAIVSFLLLDDLGDLPDNYSIKGLYLTFIYAFVLIILNIFDVVKGPYPFLMVKNQSILASIIWLIIIIGLSYLIAIILKKLYLKFHKR